MAFVSNYVSMDENPEQASLILYPSGPGSTAEAVSVLGRDGIVEARHTFISPYHMVVVFSELHLDHPLCFRPLSAPPMASCLSFRQARGA